ncbi:MAG: proton-conducting transporter membrane subunit [Planctomycetaceae bacterium]
MMQHLVDGLLAHVMVILVVLPIVGGCAVALVSFWGEVMIRRVAITNVALTLVFAAVLAWTFVPANTAGGASTSQFQLQDQFAWALIDEEPVFKSTRASEQMLYVGFALGVDGFNLWFIVLTVALSAVAVVVSSGSRIEKPAVYYSLLLLLEGTLLAAFSARDLMLFCFCLELSIVPTVLLTGWWGAGQRQQAVRAWLPFAFVGSMLMMLAVVTLAVTTVDSRRGSEMESAGPTLRVEDLARQTESMLLRSDLALGHRTTEQLRAGIYFIVWLGIAVQMGVVPFHAGSRALLTQAPLAVKLIWFGAGLKIGGCAIVRLMLVLLPLGSWVAGDEMVMVAVAGSLFAGLAMWSRPTVEDRLGYFTAHQMGLCMAGLFCLNAIGIAGGLLLALGHGLGLSLFVVARSQMLSHFSSVRSRNAMLWMGCLSLLPIPGLATLPGTVLVVAGVFLGHGNQPHPVLVLVLLTGVVTASCALASGVHHGLAIPDSKVGTHEVRRKPPLQYGVVTSLLLLASLGLGLAPNLVLRSVQPAVHQLLDRNVRMVRQGFSRIAPRGPRSVARSRP